MRKHRLFGVAFAVLLVAGPFGYRASAPRSTAGVDLDHVGISLARADIPAHATTEPSTEPSGAAVATGFVVLRPSFPEHVEALWSLKAGLAADLAPAPSPPAPKPSAPTPRPAPGATLVAVRPAPSSAGVWAALRQCESNGNYADDTGNGYYGAYQFSLATWRGLGQGGLPSQAPPAVQDLAAQRLQARSGWGQWPLCSRRLGLL